VEWVRVLRPDYVYFKSCSFEPGYRLSELPRAVDKMDVVLPTTEHGLVRNVRNRRRS
jgi:hypothetical protein